MKYLKQFEFPKDVSGTGFCEAFMTTQVRDTLDQLKAKTNQVQNDNHRLRAHTFMENSNNYENMNSKLQSFYL